ncbi:MAG: hypothetical protein ACREIA_16415 [Opitutaceae bacterium]
MAARFTSCATTSRSFRDLRNITAQFPERAAAARSCPADFIADGELLAWRDGRALPFAELQRRLGRRGDDFFPGSEVPVSLWLYDLLWVDGHDLLKAPLSERRAHLGQLPLPAGLVVAPRQEAHGIQEINTAFERARDRGNEGLMAKDPNSLYLPGRRRLAWLKLKRVGGTLDVVVTAVEFGHGKRRGVLSGYTFSVRDTGSGALRVVGKAYSGLTDAEIAKLTEHFHETTLEVRGHLRVVEPVIVLEVAFDAIQRSSRHDSGFALRFPRIARIREDKSPDQIDTVETCRRLVARLRKRRGCDEKVALESLICEAALFRSLLLPPCYVRSHSFSFFSPASSSRTSAHKRTPRHRPLRSRRQATPNPSSFRTQSVFSASASGSSSGSSGALFRPGPRRSKHTRPRRRASRCACRS